MARLTFRQIFIPSGLVDRGTYALFGVLGVAIKHNIDRFIASYFFNQPWSPFNYWAPLREVTHITQLHGDQAQFLAVLLASALPFIWVGVVLTLQRLRSAGLPLSLVALFFVPFVNLLFFLVLCLYPERKSAPDLQTQPSSLARVLPAGKLGSAAIALLFTVTIGFGIAYLGAQVLTTYGWGLFVALPFVMGFVTALIYGANQPRTVQECIAVACFSVGLLGAALFAMAFEGVFCLIMAAPIALPLAAFGGYCAYHIQKRRRHNDAPVFLSALLLVAPGVEYIEHVIARPSPVFVVHTAIDVQAPPEKVWNEVIAFSQIPAPTELMFRAGIAYPIRAEMFGSGVGAERHCVFSTGSFVEPIQVWDAPHLLKFSVTSNPPPMEEWTPYHHIEPPHLHGFLVSEGGQFLLTPLPNGGTHLEGTTWYHHGLWPSAYWRLWSDAIIHRIHLRVLNHIRAQAEANS
jgi:hypothetical protein